MDNIKFFGIIILLIFSTSITPGQTPVYESYVGVRLGQIYEYVVDYTRTFSGQQIITFRNVTYPGYDLGNTLNLTTGDNFSVYFDPDTAHITGKLIDYAQYQIISAFGNVTSYSTFSGGLISGQMVESIDWDNKLPMEYQLKYNLDHAENRDPRDRAAVINTPLEFGINQSLHSDPFYVHKEDVYEKSNGMLLYRNFIESKDGVSFEQQTIRRAGYTPNYAIDFSISSSNTTSTSSFPLNLSIVILVVLIQVKRKLR